MLEYIANNVTSEARFLLRIFRKSETNRLPTRRCSNINMLNSNACAQQHSTRSVTVIISNRPTRYIHFIPIKYILSQIIYFIAPQASVVGQGQILRIEIPSEIPQLAFKGFIIHARTPNGRVVGRFAASADGLVKLINCDGLQNTATHSNTVISLLIQ